MAARETTDRTPPLGAESQALVDPLTGLPNRLLLIDRAKRALGRLHRAAGLVAMLFIDLDRFKAVNDGLGHTVGDDLLIAVSKRLEQAVRESDTVSRFGGDEFVVLADDLEGETEALGLAERVLSALEEPFTVGAAAVSMRASVGISVCRESGKDPEDLLREADVAMYRAKAAGGRGLDLFDEDLRREMSRRLEVEVRLREALARQELRLVYQPVLRLADGLPVACEALLRWHPEDGPPMLPREFLHLAEENNMIVSISEWVLRSACAQAAAWRRAGCKVVVSINVSPRGLAKLEIAERLRAALERSGLPAPCLCIEVSEAAVMADLDRATTTLLECKRLGVRVALDNYGSGHASLSLPGMLPLDAIKLDRSLIKGMEGDPYKRAIAIAATAMARESGVTPVAVGIESHRQLDLAMSMGCDFGQGNMLCAPEPPERLSLYGDMAVRSPMQWTQNARIRRHSHRQSGTRVGRRA